MHRLARSLVALAIAAALHGCASEEDPPSLTDAGASDGGADSSDASASADGGGADTGSLPDASSIMDQCDPVDQTGCAAPASKCIVENVMPMGGALCVEPGNDVARGMACTAGDCQPGLVCVRTSTSAIVCEQVCDYHGDGGGCEPLGANYECLTRLTGTNWGACQLLPPVCDPLTQDPCALDQACRVFTRRTGQYEFRCRPAGTQQEGQPCGSAGGGDCARGLVCVRSGTTNEVACRKFCDTNDDCTAPLTCSGQVNDPPFQYCAS